MARPRLILIIRHGESEGNKDKTVNRYIPNHKVNLTEHGHQQAKLAGLALRKYLKKGDSICFYTSPYQRTRQTTDDIVEGIKDTGVPYEVFEEPRMREQDFGNFQSPPEEMQRMWVERSRYGHFFYRIPSGESAADVYDRCASFNATLFRQFNQKDFPSILVLVTHGLWTRVFLMKWFRWTVEEFENKQNVPHCTWIEMERDEATDRFELKTHLATWTELEEEQRKKRLTEDTCDELRSSVSTTNLNASQLGDVVRAAADAKEEQILKALEIRHKHDLAGKKH